MENNFKVEKLGGLCSKIGSGVTPRGGNSVYKESGIPLVRSQNIYNNSFQYDGLAFIEDNIAEKMKNVQLEKDDVLINITGDSVARCTIVPDDIVGGRINQHVSIVRPDKNRLDPYYLKYYLVSSSCQSMLLSLAKDGATRAALTKKMLENLEISIPKIEEQRKIASILNCFTKKIELNNEMNKTLEEMAQAIFKSWFVDFEPFKDGEFEESELGMIPNGWQVKSLKDICQINMGQSPSSETYNSENNGLPFYQGVKDFKERFPLVTMYCSDPKKVAEKGDILLSVRAPVGSLNIAVETCCIGRGVASIKSELYGNSFVYYLLKNIKWDRYESGTVFSSIKKSDIENYKIIVPSINVVENLNKLIKSIDYKIYNNSMETMELQKIRDTVLPKLISGEIRLDI